MTLISFPPTRRACYYELLSDEFFFFLVVVFFVCLLLVLVKKRDTYQDSIGGINLLLCLHHYQDNRFNTYCVIEIFLGKRTCYIW